MRGLAWLVLMMGCAKQVPVQPMTTPSDITEARLNAMVRELVPLVEKASGLEFIEVPFVRLGRLTDLERIVQGEAGGSFDVMYPDAPEWMRDAFIRDMGGEGIAGKYAIEQRILLVSPESMARTASLVEGDPNALDSVTRLVLVHEMTHALQDQHSDLAARFDGPAHLDAYQALRGTTEGHANFVEARVAAELGLEETARALNDSQGWTDAGPDGAWSFGIWAAYGQGKNFVQWHADQGGLPRTIEVLKDPPSRTRTLFAPDEYAREVAPDPADEALLEGLEQTLQDARWFTSSGPVVEMELREQLYGVPGPELEATLAAVRGGAMRSAVRSDRSANFVYLRFDDADQAITAMELLDRFSDSIAEQLSPSPAITALIQTDAVDELGDDARSVDVAMTSDGERSIGVSSESHALWVRRGAHVVVVQARGFRPGERLKQAAQRALERLQ